MYDEIFNNNKIFNVLNEPVDEEVVNEAKEFLESLGEEPLEIKKIIVVNPHLLRICLEQNHSICFELDIGQAFTSYRKDRMSLVYLNYYSEETEEDPSPNESFNCNNITKDMARKIILLILEERKK